MNTYKDINKNCINSFEKEIADTISVPNKCDMNYNTYELNCNDLGFDYCNVEKNKLELQYLLNEVSKNVKLSKIVDMDQIRNEYIKSVDKLKSENYLLESNEKNNTFDEIRNNKNGENIGSLNNTKNSTEIIGEKDIINNSDSNDDILNLKNEILFLLEKRSLK